MFGFKVMQHHCQCLSDELSFVIPTYRLRDVGKTVEEYDQHFWQHGHSVRLMVFDDSAPAAQEKYYPFLGNTRTHQSVYYVGPREKDQLLNDLVDQLRDRRLETLVRNLFRPSYGGNRNFTLLYTLGGLMVSSDDDMRPFCLVEHRQEPLGDNEVSRGRLREAGANGYTWKSFDLISAFLDVLGRAVSEVPERYKRGELLVDTATDLVTNCSKGLVYENSLMLQAGAVPDTARIKLAQTFRSGTNDVDAIDFVNMMLDDELQLNCDTLNNVYVLEDFRPVITNQNWRMDCGVAAYDNTFGLPPFFPTQLRFEDYSYRLWAQRDGIAAAHVDAAQNHCRSNYMRCSLAEEVLNEEVANLLKRKIKDTVTRLDELSIDFDYDGTVTAHDVEHIVEKVAALHGRAVAIASVAWNPDRARALRRFAANLDKLFYGFVAESFDAPLARIVDEAVRMIKGSIELWPNLIEIAFVQKRRSGLPCVYVNNHRK